MRVEWNCKVVLCDAILSEYTERFPTVRTVFFLASSPWFTAELRKLSEVHVGAPPLLQRDCPASLGRTIAISLVLARKEEVLLELNLSILYQIYCFILSSCS